MESNNHNQKKKGKYSEVFKDTYDKCEKITILKESIEESIKLTKLYLEGHKFDLDKKLIKSNDYNIIITPERTLEAVYKYYIQTNKKNKIGVLNFASGKHPGGGVTKGRGGAQEESLCRISTLYPCLNTEFLNENYYSYHIEKRTENTDRIIYIPNVIVFKLDGENIEIIKDYKDWYNINVICCAAHNQKAYKIEFEKLKIINYNKIKAIIECAVENNIDNLILGAFGCGVFANPSELVSKTFKKILIDEEYYKYFENVHFAIFSKSNNDKNLNEFKNVFQNFIKNNNNK